MSTPTLAPVSVKTAMLLHALYAEVLAQAEALPAGTIVLQAPRPGLKVRFNGCGMCIESDPYLRDHAAIWRHHDIDGPNYFGEEVRRDPAGREWTRSFHATVDDFGDLVEVPR